VGGKRPFKTTKSLAASKQNTGKPAAEMTSSFFSHWFTAKLVQKSGSL
jgi:hypothetical protein